jgi:hypothetical protein
MALSLATSSSIPTQVQLMSSFEAAARRLLLESFSNTSANSCSTSFLVSAAIAIERTEAPIASHVSSSFRKALAIKGERLGAKRSGQDSGSTCEQAEMNLAAGHAAALSRDVKMLGSPGKTDPISFVAPTCVWLAGALGTGSAQRSVCCLPIWSCKAVTVSGQTGLWTIPISRNGTTWLSSN